VSRQQRNDQGSGVHCRLCTPLANKSVSPHTQVLVCQLVNQCLASRRRLTRRRCRLGDETGSRSKLQTPELRRQGPEAGVSRSQSRRCGACTGTAPPPPAVARAAIKRPQRPGRTASQWLHPVSPLMRSAPAAAPAQARRPRWRACHTCPTTGRLRQFAPRLAPRLAPTSPDAGRCNVCYRCSDG
jgi:hypothetical protein